MKKRVFISGPILGMENNQSYRQPITETCVRLGLEVIDPWLREKIIYKGNEACWWLKCVPTDFIQRDLEDADRCDIMVIYLPRLSAGACMEMFYAKRKGKKKLLIIGAGYSGEKICREINNNPNLRYTVIGFLDDDREKIGRAIHGISVIGSIDDLIAVTNKTNIDEILIAITSANSSQMRRIIDACKAVEIPFKTVPGYSELINGNISVKTIRDVAYRDLLGRKIVKLDEAGIESYLKGKTVMVTGAGGSIGSELCRQICRFAPKRILLFERAESPLYHIELELREHFSTVEIIPALGDILNKDQLETTFDQFNPSVVFHAAAYKHVPMLEIRPRG